MQAHATVASILRRCPAIRRCAHFPPPQLLRPPTLQPAIPSILQRIPQARFVSQTVTTHKLLPTTRPILNTLPTLRNNRVTSPLLLSATAAHIRSFHSTRPNSGLPYFIVVLLKSSTSLQWTQTIGRIAMTMFPIAVAKRWFIRRYTKMFPPEKYPHLADMYAKMARGLKFLRLTTWFIFLVPGVLFVITILASMERTPLTGRWRVILLSPEEEEGIAQQLAGAGWYNAVAEILGATSPKGLPRVIPPEDWRTQWVLDTLRRLESAIPYLQDEQRSHPMVFADQSPDSPIPPPSDFPLIPRPRVTQSWHLYAESVTDPDHHDDHLPPHSLLGPPYSLLLVERPDASNAFSYGFGPEGGGGIVVYSGFIDEILKATETILSSEQPAAPAPAGSVFSLFSPSGGRTPQTRAQQTAFTPTAEQTSQLAILLAHELSHLILSHHLETLSSASIFLPSLMSILSDVLRTVLFPVTMLLGPFVQDGIAELGRMGLGEVTRVGESCSSRKMEVEADIVSVRILAYAGFDARSAVKFWESRNACEDTTSPGTDQQTRTRTSALSFWPWMKNDHDHSHPIGETRVQALKRELTRWDDEAKRRGKFKTTPGHPSS